MRRLARALDAVRGNRRLVAGLWIVAVGVSFAAYGLAHELVHFGWHLAYGVSLGLVLGVLVARFRGREPAAPGLWALGGYGFMVIPDLLWVLPLLWGGQLWPHQPWMNVFLGHVALDHWRLASVLAVPAVLAAAALWTWSAADGGA